MGDLPKCTICNFSPIVVSDKYVMHDDNKRCPLSSAEDMTPEQWTKLMGQGDAVCHVFPDDFERLKNSECYATCYSVEMTDQNRGRTVPLYATPAVDDGVLRDAERRDVCAIANRICGEIPDDFHIEMVLENGAGWVSLFHKGKPVDIDMADWNIAEQFDVAMRCVKEIVQEQQDAKADN